MKLQELFTEERAVSPVIGVILMVAITVILAAVIGAFVLGLGGETQETPQVSLSFSGDASGVNIEHRAGNSVDFDELEARGSALENDPFTFEEGTFRAGDDVDIVSGDLDEEGGNLRIIWTGGSDDAVLGSYEVEGEGEEEEGGEE